jgi:hypothetical protein
VYSPTRKRKKKASTTRSPVIFSLLVDPTRKVSAIYRTVEFGNACCGSGGGSNRLHFSFFFVIRGECSIGVVHVLAWICSHALGTPEKRFRDLRRRSSSSVVVVTVTVPQGASKGQEQVASFQVLVGFLQSSSEESVLCWPTSRANQHHFSSNRCWMGLAANKRRRRARLSGGRVARSRAVEAMGKMVRRI